MPRWVTYLPNSLIAGRTLGPNDCFMIRTDTGLMRLAPGMKVIIPDEEFEKLKKDGQIGGNGPLKEITK
ncbi:MAG: hypothetical protein ABSD41_09995 [Candidatus Bathyarchaeia archaeon]